MFAVIKTGGRQYRVVPDDVLEIGKIAGDVGTIVQLGEVLLVGGDSPVLGAPTVAAPMDGDDEAPRAVKKKAAPKKAVARKTVKPRAKPDAKKAAAKGKSEKK